MRGLLHFHQGWTDILNCLPLVNFYSCKYDIIDVIVREDAKTIFDFYIRDNKKINAHYFPLETLNSLNSDDSYILNLFDVKNCDIIFHGFPGCNRKDEYSNAFNTDNAHFVRQFYDCYNIDYSNRVNLFEFKRDIALEDTTFKTFIEKNGTNYIVYHDTAERKIQLPLLSNTKNINFNNITNNIFSTIKILENAKEIHVIDSVWATFCYLLDAKYSIFNNKNIFIYPFYNRSGGCLRDNYTKKLEPVHPPNWVIKNF